MRLVYKPDHPQANENGLVERSLLAYERGDAPYVIRDEMEPLRNMADNQHYTSKAKFRAATKAAGCIEVGNETATLLKPRKPIPRSNPRDDIRRAIYNLRNGIRERD